MTNSTRPPLPSASPPPSRVRWQRLIPSGIAATALAWVLGLGCMPGLPAIEPLGRGPRAEPEPIAKHSRNLVDLEPARDAGPASSADATADRHADHDDESRADAATDAAKPDAESTTSDPKTETPVVFAGEYYGEDVSKVHIEGLPDRADRDPKARTRVEEAGDAAVRIIIVDSAKGDPLCTLNAEISGRDATIAPDQSCFSQDGMIEGTVESGKATVTGDRLVLDMYVVLRVELGPQVVDGSIDYHFDGQRR